MGNFVFCVLHLFALVFGFVFLFITIPAHLIYSGVSKKPDRSVIPDRIYKDKVCPKCNALITDGAMYCWSCGGPSS